MTEMSEEVELPKPTLIEDLGMMFPTKNSKQKKRFGRYECGFCGEEFRTQTSKVKSGETKSCGCYQKRRASKILKTHGLIETRLYSIWANMKKRILNPKFIYYPYYGGRGIIICDEWKNDFMSFYNWAMSNGYSDELSIDRIDNDGNYEPSNCRWVTQTIQVRNQRMKKNNKTGFKGVSFVKSKDHYVTFISVDKNSIYLGSFSTAEEGAIAYNNYIIENNLEGFNLNEIPEDYLNQIKKEERIEKSFINR